MRTFPLSWVFPGGNIDVGETLEQAAKREVLEEVGLTVDNLQLIALWESCYPNIFEDGPIQRQHIVCFFKAQLSPPPPHQFPFYDFIQLQTDEVDSATWVPREQIPQLLSSDPNMILPVLFIGGSVLTRTIIPRPASDLHQSQQSLKDISGNPRELISKATQFVLRDVLLLPSKF